MFQEAANPAELLASIEKRLHLSLDLKQELIASRAAYAARNLDAIYYHIGAQSLLCMQLQQSGDVKRAGQNTLAASSVAVSYSSPFASRQQELLVELAAAEQEIRELNLQLIVLVKGSRRTFNMIANAMANFSPTYARPAIQFSPAERRHQP
jgi:hypothetical protein